ncbi:hypothetical protein ACFRMQ_00355 [Kitasatospora sp. NPDC056783]|uniref:hypothetical protein n=1 Tax=Kitasatospora sp. NPDC056783 TaxID=3345943 RepID=UPI003686882E
MPRSFPAPTALWAAGAPSPGTDGLAPDPGAGVPLAERARVVAEATGLPVAVLDDAAVPSWIDADSEPVDGRMRYAGVTAHYDGGLSVSVRARRTLPEPANVPTGERLAAAGGLFADGTLVVDGVTYLAVGCRALPRGPVKGWTACAAGWLVTVRGAAHRTGVRLLHAGAAVPGPGHPVPRRGTAAFLAVPLLEDGDAPRITPVTGPATGWRSTYPDGTGLLLTGPLALDEAARLALGDEPIADGPETFVQIDGRTLAARLRSSGRVSARVADLEDARGPRTLVLVTPGRSHGPTPRIVLTDPPGGGRAIGPGTEDVR